MTKLLPLIAFAAASASGQTLQVIYTFQNNANGVNPQCTLVEAERGIFEGTTTGGENGATIFQVTSAGKVDVVATLNPATQGYFPLGQLYPASNGFLYGVTTFGDGGYSGSVFAIGASVNILQSDSISASPLIEASDGNLYGVEGNAATGNYHVFRMSPSGSLTVIYNLGPNARSIGPLFQGSDGNLYGMTAGVNNSHGFIFRLNTAGENFAIVHTFNAGQGGQGGLMEASNGLLYGVAVYGYPYSPCPGIGSHLFSLSLSGEFTAFEAFTGCPGPGPNGPETGLVEASDGNLYGTTVTGGGYSAGTIFRIGLNGSSFDSIVNFGHTLGAEPGGIGGTGLIQGSDGWLYGTASSGGDYGWGTVFRLSMNLPPPLPVVSLVQPASGAPGTTVRIAGQHLLGVTSVEFNGESSSSVTSRGTNYVLAVVPAGATSGPVSVTTQNGTGTSKVAFTVDE